MLCSHNKVSQRKESVTEKIIRKRKHIYGTQMQLLKKKKVDLCKWTCMVHTHAVQAYIRVCH